MCVTEAMFKPVEMDLPYTAETTVVNIAISTKVTASVSSHRYEYVGYGQYIIYGRAGR